MIQRPTRPAILVFLTLFWGNLLFSAPEMTSIELKVGETKVLKVSELTDVSISNDMAVDVVTLSKEEILINAKGRGISDVAIRDALGTTLYRFQVSSNYDEVKERLTRLIDNDSVQIDIVDKIEDKKPVIMVKGEVSDSNEKLRIIGLAKTIGEVRDLLTLPAGVKDRGMKIIEPKVEEELTNYFCKQFKNPTLVVKSMESKFAKVLFPMAVAKVAKEKDGPVEGTEKTVDDVPDMALILEGVVDSKILMKNIGKTAKLYSKYVINQIKVDPIADFKRKQKIREEIMKVLETEIQNYNAYLSDALNKLINCPTAKATVTLRVVPADLLNMKADEVSGETQKLADASKDIKDASNALQGDVPVEDSAEDDSISLSKLNISGILTKAPRSILLEGTVPDQNIFAEVVAVAKGFLVLKEQMTSEKGVPTAAEKDNVLEDIQNKLIIINPIQIQFSAYIVEIEKKLAKEVGIDWGSLPSGKTSYEYSNFTQGILRLGEDLTTALHGDVPVIGAPVSKFINPFDMANINRTDPVGALLKLHADDAKIRLLANPKIVIYAQPYMMMNPANKEFFAAPEKSKAITGSISIGGTSFLKLTGAQGVPSTEKQPFGTILTIYSPTFYQGRYDFRLNLSSSLPVSGGGEVLNQKERTAYSVVSMREGETLALGGLIDEDESKVMRKVPFIHEIPVFGKLFRSESFNNRKSELMLFITPALTQPLKVQTQGPQFKELHPATPIAPMTSGKMGMPQELIQVTTPAPLPPMESVIPEAPKGVEIKPVPSQPEALSKVEAVPGEKAVMEIPTHSDRLERLHRIFDEIKTGKQ